MQQVQAVIWERNASRRAEKDGNSQTWLHGGRDDVSDTSVYRTSKTTGSEYHRLSRLDNQFTFVCHLQLMEPLFPLSVDGSLDAATTRLRALSRV